MQFIYLQQRDLILEESLKDLDLYPELIQPLLLNVLQCKVPQSF